MEISDQDLRAMVRDAISRLAVPVASPAETEVFQVLLPGHASHGLLAAVVSGDPDGRCLIEPAVQCNHCGYCRSLGH